MKVVSRLLSCRVTESPGPRDAERVFGALSATATSRHRCHRGATANRIGHSYLDVHSSTTSPPDPSPPPPLASSSMALATQSGPTSSMSREGSRTAVVVQNAAEQRDASALLDLDEAPAPPAGTLRLRGGPRNGPRVAWDEDVVDNEGLGRKKSKSTSCALEKEVKC
jgi:hypothetical protein